MGRDGCLYLILCLVPFFLFSFFVVSPHTILYLARNAAELQKQGQNGDIPRPSISGGSFSTFLSGEWSVVRFRFRRRCGDGPGPFTEYLSTYSVLQCIEYDAPYEYEQHVSSLVTIVMSHVALAHRKTRCAGWESRKKEQKKKREEEKNLNW